MKKLLLLFIIISITLTLTACGEKEAKIKELPIEEKNFNDAMSSLKLEDSVTIKTTLKDFPLLGDIESTIKIQGDEIEMIIFDESLYMVSEDDVMYVLVESGGTYIKQEADIEDQEAANTDLGFKYEDFTFEDGVYKANLTIDEMRDLVVLITDGQIVSMTFTAKIPDLNKDIETVMEFIDFGTTTVNLPTYE